MPIGMVFVLVEEAHLIRELAVGVHQGIYCLQRLLEGFNWCMKPWALLLSRTPLRIPNKATIAWHSRGDTLAGAKLCSNYSNLARVTVIDCSVSAAV